MANTYIHESVSKFARGVKRLLLIGGLALLASCGGDAALKAEQVQTFNKQVIKLDTERHSLLSSLYSTAKRSGGVTPSGKSVTNAELLAQNPAVLKMVGAEKTLAKPQRVQSQTLVSSTFSPVFRIQNGDLPGSYFFTIYESERIAALAANPNWSYEGPAFYTSQAEEGGLSPVWRFRNLINGSYVFTIYESERQSIVNDYSSVFAYEGVSWYARQTEALGFTPLYRFRNVTNGTYLFSAYESEKVAILENYASTFVYEGVAYYVQVPGGTSATPPAMQVTNQSAVLKPSVITGIDASLTKVDQIGNFTSAAGRTWAKDQVFMYQGRAYKVVGVIVNAVGTTSLSTVQPRLDTIYDDLKFTFKANALAYDANLQPKGVSLIAQATSGTQHQTQALSSIRSFTPMAGVNGPACLVPKNVEEGKLTTSSVEWGYSWELNNCSLNDLLILDSSDPLFNIHVNGQMKHSGEMTHEFDKAAETNYTETSQSSEIELTFSGTLTSAQRDLLKAKKDICNDSNGVLECEKNIPIGPAATVAIGPVPVTYQIGIGFSFTVDINGQISHKYHSTVVTKKGYKNGEKIDETNKTGGGFKAPETTLNGSAEIDLFGFGSIDVGIGAEGADLEAYLVKLETKAGPYGSVSAKAELPVCVKYEAGGRIKAEVKILKILDFNLFNFDNQVNFPLFLNGAIPLGCDVPGKVHVGYVIYGRDYYAKNLAASTDTTDVYDAGKFLIGNPSANGKFTIDLSATRGIKGKDTEYSVDIVSGTTSNASMDSFVVSPANSVAPYVKALINHGNTTYGDVVRFKIAAYDPTNRVATETSRIVEIRIEPAMSAAPKYRQYVSTNGAEGYLANYWYGSSGAVLTANQAKSGYWQANSGDKFNFSIDATYAGDDITVNTAADRVNLRPQRLALLSKLDRAGSEQLFNFVELTDVVISSVNISPFQPTVGNLATFTVTGDGLPGNLAVNIPNCSAPVEVRSAGNIAKNNYATGVRVFTCTPFASGENLTATFGAYSKLFTIPSQACLAGQTLVNGVCTTAPVAGNIDLPATSYLRGTNVALSVNGYGADALMNAPPYIDVPNAAEWDFVVPVTGSYQLFAIYASGESRPSQISFNGTQVFANALSSTTGGFFPANRQTLLQGIVQLTAGANTMRVSRISAFPHIKGFTLVLVNSGVGLLNPANGHRYEVITCGAWNQCDAAARAKGGNLVTIRNSAENTWLLANIFNPSSNVMFIGLFKTGSTWSWSSGEPVAFTAWLPGNPDNYLGNQNYVHLSSGNLLWDDVADAFYGPATQAIVEYSNSGTLSVAANLSTGTQFTVPAGATSCTFNASGTWNNATSSYTAVGDINTMPSQWPNYYTWPMSTSPFFSLIALKSGVPFYIGNQATLSVTSGQSISFVANDSYYSNSFAVDNTGALSVSYNCN